jgi:hypothetical protein
MKEWNMQTIRRRTFLLVVTMAAALALSNGVAFAITNIVCKVGKPCWGDNTPNVIKGTGYADTIVGLAGNDNINGNGGNDTIYSGSDGDVVYGGYGNDKIYPYEGNDTVHGGPGNDTILDVFANVVLLYDSNDNIYAEDGNDKITLWFGTDRAFGGKGTDTMVIRQERIPYIAGGADRDYINVYDSDEPDVYGDWGDDVIKLINGTGEQDAEGNDGNDTIIVKSDSAQEFADVTGDWGSDDIGKPGNDVIDVADGHPNDDVMCGGGYDTVTADVTRDSDGFLDPANSDNVGEPWWAGDPPEPENSCEKIIEV